MLEQRYIPTNLWDVLKAQGRTIRWLAAQSGVTENMLTKVKHGYRKSLSAETARRIALVLAVPFDLVFAPCGLHDGSEMLQSGRAVVA